MDFMAPLLSPEFLIGGVDVLAALISFFSQPQERFAGDSLAGGRWCDALPRLKEGRREQSRAPRAATHARRGAIATAAPHVARSVLTPHHATRGTA
jgi:hypothetical protein